MSFLHIKNFTLIQELEINFYNGFSVITGETGSGKSILIDALGLVLGSRADKETVFEADLKCVVEGHFVTQNSDIKHVLKDQGLDEMEVLILRREILPSGKSRAFVNDSPVQLNVLKTIGGYLVDIHSQHDTLSILKPSHQLNYLDAFSQNKLHFNKYKEEWKIYKRLKDELEQIEPYEGNAQNDKDYVLFQINELEKLNIKEGEQEKLEADLKYASNLDNIKRTLSVCDQKLNSDSGGILDELRTVGIQLNNISDNSPLLNELYERVSSSLIELKDISESLQEAFENDESDGFNLSFIESRLEEINRLCHKHKLKNGNDLLKLKATFDAKVEEIERNEITIKNIKSDFDVSYIRLKKAGEDLRKNRFKTAEVFQNSLMNILKDLELKDANFSVQITENELSYSGGDRIEFLFSANKGSELKPLKSVASGGEMARLMLAIKSIINDNYSSPTLIFDEIDSGVSGLVAAKVALLMKKIGNENQVVSITHLPQIAGKSDYHYQVNKVSSENKTFTNVVLMSENQRVEVLASMLSAENGPTEAAISNAKELLNS